MNWLAHILLSKKEIEYQLGNLLADPLKGKSWEGASPSFMEGLAMHKAIDRFTDTHPIVSRSKRRLGAKGHLKGVVIDILYDHFLAAGWADYVDISLSDFLETFYSNAAAAVQVYPDEPKAFVEALVLSDILAKYAGFDGFISTLQRLDKRFSARIRAREFAESHVCAVAAEYEHLKKDFAEFFPELILYFKHHRLGCTLNNELINIENR